MKKYAFAIAFSLAFSAACLSQQRGWKTEHHDTMVVPPNAADVTFTERGHQDELTYTVEEPYPARKFVDGLCEEMRLKQWVPDGPGVCLKPDWIKVPPPSRVKYRVVLAWEKFDKDYPNGVGASYDLEYMTAEGEHRAHTLHVDTWAIHNVAAPPRQRIAPAKPRPSILRDPMTVFGSLFLCLLVLIGLVWLLASTKARSAPRDEIEPREASWAASAVRNGQEDRGHPHEDHKPHNEIDMAQSPSVADAGTSPRAKSSVRLMALAGLISAVLISPIWIVYLLIGPLWGLALVVYFFAYEKNRNVVGLLLFLFVSGSAFWASLATASLLPGQGSLWGMGAAYFSLPSLPFLFIAGSTGAVIVLAAGVFVFGCGGLKRKTIANILLGAVAGGLLAVVAGFAGENMPFEARSGVIDFGYALVFLLWQPGVAGILGLTLNADRKSAVSAGAVPQHAVSRARQIAIGIAAVLCLLSVVARQAYIGFEQRQFRSQLAAEHQHYVAATPPPTDVSVVQSAHPEQLFPPGEISGLIFCPASLKTTPRTFRQRAHGFLYEARYDYAHSNLETTPCGSWLAIVDIMDVPDAAWSRFEAQYPLDVYVENDSHFQPTVKFSQNVFNKGECYSWPSGHLAIELCYEAFPENEDLLQQFLQKYPSTMPRAR